jgi:hypothetical protein
MHPGIPLIICALYICKNHTAAVSKSGSESEPVFENTGFI